MLIKGVISEDFVNYKKASMTIMFPYCTFKCGKEICQNSPLAESEDVNLSIQTITNMYITNPITESIVMQGLEPFDSWNDLYELVAALRERTQDDIVIYTGYYKAEIADYINDLKNFPNIIIKFGRYIPNQNQYYDEVLGVLLASDNQYAERIS